jgi:hypothetical protein
MSIRRCIGLILVILAGLALAYDLVTGLAGGGTLGLLSLGELWGHLNAASLNLVQAIEQRYLFPALWDPILVTLLLSPASLAVGVLGLALYLYPIKSSEIAT